MNRTKKKVVSLLMIAALAGTFAQNAIAAQEVPEENAAQRTITVSADGSVQVVPDMAEFTFGIQSEGTTAEEAQKSNGETVDSVISSLLKDGVAEKDIKTTSMYLYPQYDYNTDNSITGYIQTTELSVSGQKIEAAGQIIADAISAGANELHQVRYTFSQYEEAYDQALTQAVQNARGKGLVLAAAAGGSLGDVLVITEGYQDTSARYKLMDNYAFEEMATMDTAAVGASGMSIMPGETEIRAQVTVTYDLNP